MDTERAKTAYDIANNYGFKYYDQSQLGMYKEYGDSFGNEIWLWQERQQCKVWIGFRQHHDLCIRIDCNQKSYAAELVETVEGCNYVRNEERLIEFSHMKHFKSDDTYRVLSEELEKLFDIIPEIQALEGLN